MQTATTKQANAGCVAVLISKRTWRVTERDKGYGRKPRGTIVGMPSSSAYREVNIMGSRAVFTYEQLHDNTVATMHDTPNIPPLRNLSR